MNDLISQMYKANPPSHLEALTSSNKKKILIVDSDMEFTTSIEYFLVEQGFDVTLCRDGKEALQRANSRQFDLILLDIVMPSVSGFELLKKLRPFDKTHVMILTARNDLFDKIYGLELGADDYLLKPMNHRELLARINAIFRRVKKLDRHQSHETESINDIRICISTREAFCCEKLLKLTGHEFEVLHFLLLNAGNVVSKDEIVEYVHGRTMPYNDRSIDMHICNIRKKISAIAPEQKIKTIRGSGYIFIKKLN